MDCPLEASDKSLSLSLFKFNKVNISRTEMNIYIYNLGVYKSKCMCLDVDKHHIDI